MLRFMSTSGVGCLQSKARAFRGQLGRRQKAAERRQSEIHVHHRKSGDAILQPDEAEDPDDLATYLTTEARGEHGGWQYTPQLWMLLLDLAVTTKMGHSHLSDAVAIILTRLRICKPERCAIGQLQCVSCHSCQH